MKLKIAIFFAFLLLSVYTETISYLNEDGQSILIEFKAPTVDPTNKVLRIEFFVISQYPFVQNYNVGAICAVTGPDGVFPRDVVSGVFAIGINCAEANGCIPGTDFSIPSIRGTVDGKNFNLFKTLNNSTLSVIF